MKNTVKSFSFFFFFLRKKNAYFAGYIIIILLIYTAVNGGLLSSLSFGWTHFRYYFIFIFRSGWGVTSSSSLSLSFSVRISSHPQRHVLIVIAVNTTCTHISILLHLFLVKRSIFITIFLCRLYICMDGWMYVCMSFICYYYHIFFRLSLQFFEISLSLAFSRIVFLSICCCFSFFLSAFSFVSECISDRLPAHSFLPYLLAFCEKYEEANSLLTVAMRVCVCMYIHKT